MLRIRQDVADHATLDDAAALHDGEMGGETNDQGKIMGDQQIGEPAELLQRSEQSQNLGLQDEIEAGEGFIEDQQLRRKSKGAGNGEPLPLATAKRQYGLLRQFSSEAGQAHAIQSNFAAPAFANRALNI